MKETEKDLVYIDKVFIGDRDILLYRNGENKIEGWFAKPNARLVDGQELRRIITPCEASGGACQYIREFLSVKRKRVKEIPPMKIPFPES